MMESQFELLKQRTEQGDAAAQWDLALYYCEHPDHEKLSDINLLWSMRYGAF